MRPTASGCKRMTKDSAFESGESGYPVRYFFFALMPYYRHFLLFLLLLEPYLFINSVYPSNKRRFISSHVPLSVI